MHDSEPALAILQQKIAELERRIEKLSSSQSGFVDIGVELNRRMLQQEERLGRHEKTLNQLNLKEGGEAFRWFSRIHPKTRSVVFFSINFFNDNVKYAFLKFLTIARKENIDCHFLINSSAHRDMMVANGLSCLPPMEKWGIEQFNILLRAKVLVVGNSITPQMWNPPLPYYLLQGAKLVQMWHGIPYKDISPLFRRFGTNITMAGIELADILAGTGSATREQWQTWRPHRKFVVTGYPRNDALFREAAGLDLLNVDTHMLAQIKAAAAAGRKVIFYAPTWRDGIGPAWFDKANLEPFAAWCEEKGYFFFAKIHPLEHKGFEEVQRKLPHVRLAKSDADLYPLLRYADMLVTDYSSLAFDYLLLDRPIVFYRPDHAEYIARCRDLLPDYQRYTVGPEAQDIAALRKAVEETFAAETDIWAEKRRALRGEMFDHVDGNAAGRVAEVILEQLDAPQEFPSGWGA